MKALFLSAVVAAIAGAAVTVAADSPYRDVTFETLGGFEYELPDPLDPAARPDLTQVPKAVKALDGQQVRIRGFMLPIEIDRSGVSLFMLNGSLDMCYFGAPVRMNDWVLVRLAGGKKIPFTHLPVLVSGRLEVGEELRNGRVVSLYRLLADEAEGPKR